jgi:hypothetical protein
MDQQLERQLLLDLYMEYTTLAAERGLSSTELSDDQKKSLPLSDLRRIVNELKALVRTPR